MWRRRGSVTWCAETAASCSTRWNECLAEGRTLRPDLLGRPPTFLRPPGQEKERHKGGQELHPARVLLRVLTPPLSDQALRVSGIPNLPPRHQALCEKRAAEPDRLRLPGPRVCGGAT